MSALEEPRERRSVVAARTWGRPWQSPFLEALAKMPNVSAACLVAGISRQTAYRHVHEEPEFRDAWQEAVEIGFDLMERIAHQRATTGVEVVQTRRRQKRELNEQGELVVVVDDTTTDTRNEVSDQLMMFLLRGYRHRRFRDQVEHHLGPADDLERVQPVGPEDDGIHRKPTRERALELARIAQELAPGLAPVIDESGKPVE